MGMGFIDGRMEEYIKEIGLSEGKMEKDNIFYLKELSNGVFGKKEKELDGLIKMIKKLMNNDLYIYLCSVIFFNF